MAKKKIDKFLTAQIRRTAQNVSSLVRRKQKLQSEINERVKELESVQSQIDLYEVPIKEATGGFTTEQLIDRVVEDTGKVGADGKPIKITKWVFKYPETIIPDYDGLNWCNSCGEQYTCGNDDTEDCDCDCDNNGSIQPTESNFTDENV